jgi:hypothetical protein
MAVMLSPVEAWWAGLCTRPFDKLRVTVQAFMSFNSLPLYSPLPKV